MAESIKGGLPMDNELRAHDIAIQIARFNTSIHIESDLSKGNNVSCDFYSLYGKCVHNFTEAGTSE